MLSQIEGSQAVARAVTLCRPEVIAAYPISPQTHIVESLSDRVRTGELAPCEYLMVESEFGAMSACIGARRAAHKPFRCLSARSHHGGAPAHQLQPARISSGDSGTTAS